MDATSLALIFRPPRSRWGLRGGPYLWQELAQALAEQPLPDSLAAVECLLIALYQKLVSEAPRAGRRPYVDADFWLAQGLPLLRSRLLAPLG